MILIRKNKLYNSTLDELAQKYDETYKMPLNFIPPEKPLIDERLLNELKTIIKRMSDACPECKRFPSDSNCSVCHGNAGQEIDWVTVITGPEGSGKSTLAIGMLWEYCKLVGLNFAELANSFIAFDDFDMVRMITQFDPEQKYRFIFLDEGNNAFSSRESMTQTRILTIKLLNTMRFARFFTVLCSVDLNALDLTLREHRIKALIRVEKTGVYHYYSRKGLKKLYADNAKKRTLTWDWSTTTPAFMGHYYFSPEIKSAINQLKTNYMKRFKMEAGRTYKRELIKRLSGLDNDESLNTTLA